MLGKSLEVQVDVEGGRDVSAKPVEVAVVVEGEVVLQGGVDAIPVDGGEDVVEHGALGLAAFVQTDILEVKCAGSSVSRVVDRVDVLRSDEERVVPVGRELRDAVGVQSLRAGAGDSCRRVRYRRVDVCPGSQEALEGHFLGGNHFD